MKQKMENFILIIRWLKHLGILEQGYVEIVTPLEIFKLEEKEILKNRVFIISAFPEFLLDYFGVKLWKKCVKHTENLLTKQMCRAE